MGENIHRKNQSYFHFETGAINSYFSDFYGLFDTTIHSGFVICLHPVRHPSRTQQETLCLVYIGDIGNRIVIVSGPGMSFTQMVAPSITPESLGSDTGL